MFRSPLTTALILLLVMAGAYDQSAAPFATSAVQIRKYYIAADEVDWTYVPSRGDQAITGKKDDFSENPDARGILDPNQTTYRKTI
jgi:hypothetical protein